MFEYLQSLSMRILWIRLRRKYWSLILPYLERISWTSIWRLVERASGGLDVISLCVGRITGGGKGKGMTRPREYVHTRMNVHGGTSGLRINTKGKDVHAHYPRLHFNLPILQQDSGSTSSTHVQHRVGAATGTFFSTTRKRQDKWDQKKDIQLKTNNLLAVFCNLLTKK